MRTKSKFKIFLEGKTLKIIISILVIASILVVIVVPSIMTSKPKWAAISFNRDATSGTREAFAEKVLEVNANEFSPGTNVREVKNNESMIKSVVKNEHSIGYVSFGTVANFTPKGHAYVKDQYKDKDINYATIDGVSPDKDNLKAAGNYEAKRNFNSFFRVKNNTDESKILNWDWNDPVFNGPSTLKGLNNDLKASYLFYSWMDSSKQAEKILNTESEVPTQNNKIDFSDALVENYINDVNLNLNKEVKISIVGSTSARKVLDLLSTDIKDKSFIYLAKNNWGFKNIEFEKATNGSGDAFKDSIAGATDPYIGLQSREPKSSELKKWGWDSDHSKVYVPFAIDALLVVYNTKGLNDPLVTDPELRKKYKKHRNLKGSKKILELYQSNDWVRFDEILTLINKGGGQ